jgi:hypothetical protein
MRYNPITTMNKVKDSLQEGLDANSRHIKMDSVQRRHTDTVEQCKYYRFMTTDRLVLDGRMTRSSMQEMKKTPKPGWTGLIEKLENRHSNFEIG